MADAASATSWSASEGKILIEALKKLGNKWADISKLIDAWTAGQCQRRWRSNAIRTSSRTSIKTILFCVLTSKVYIHLNYELFASS